MSDAEPIAASETPICPNCEIGRLGSKKNCLVCGFTSEKAESGDKRTRAAAILLAMAVFLASLTIVAIVAVLRS